MISSIHEGAIVSFPKFKSERAYQVPFRKGESLPKHLSRWQHTVDAMVKDVDTDKEMYLMVDQGVVANGHVHRRGGKHIDGNWVCSGMWDTGGGQWNTGGGGWDTGGGGRWNTKGLTTGGIILASNVAGCKAYLGEFEGSPAEGGDCDHIDVSGGKELSLKPNRVYTGSVNLIHESVPIFGGKERTLVRVTLPEDYRGSLQ